MDDICENIEEYNPYKTRKILIVFNDMNADMLSNNKPNLIVTEFFISGRKSNISFVFLTHLILLFPKYYTKLNTLFCYENFKQRKLQQIEFNHSSNIDFQKSMNFFKKCTEKPYSFLVIDTILALGNLSHFRENLVEIM